MSGIQRPQKEYTEGNRAFDPLICASYDTPTSELDGSASGHSDRIHKIEFDLSVTITATSSVKAGGKAGRKSLA